MKMKKVTLNLIAACTMIVGVGGHSFAQDTPTAIPELSTKLDVSYVSKYVWRGIPQTQDGAVQPSLTLTHASGMSFNYWASDDSKAGKLTENDYTLNYAWNAKGVGMNGGYVYYAFPNTAFASTSELYASACFNGLLSPSVSVNYDVDEANGYYAALSAGYACTMPWSKAKPTNLNLSGRLGISSANYNQFWYGVDKFAVSDLYLSASVPFTIAGKATLTPSLSYSTVINGKLRDSLSANGLKSDNIVGSMTMSYAF